MLTDSFFSPDFYLGLNLAVILYAESEKYNRGKNGKQNDAPGKRIYSILIFHSLLFIPTHAFLW